MQCHPKISAICNDLFYDGKLADGVKEEARLPIVPGFSTLTCIDVKEGKEGITDSSFYNQKEAQLIVQLIVYLLGIGLETKDIGVISLCKCNFYFCFLVVILIYPPPPPLPFVA